MFDTTIREVYSLDKEVSEYTNRLKGSNMDEKKNAMSYEEFQETASDYGEDKGHDFLTDPAAIAKASEKAKRKGGEPRGYAPRSPGKARVFP